MGILRVYLALCVVAAHANAGLFWRMHDSAQAVQIFYIISGFYMAMVLSSRYATPRDFYVSRLLRIFPPYWIVLVATLVVSAGSGLLFHQWLLLEPYVYQPLERNGAAGIWLTAVSNATLVGQDWIHFLSNDAGRPLHFTSYFWGDHSPLWHYLLVPQSWSIAIELTFYALAPFLNRLRTQLLVFITVAAFAARLIAYERMGLAHDPWTYRFFPFELGLFLIGMLGYRLYARTKPHHPSPRFKCLSRSSYLAGALALLLLLYLHVRVVVCLDRLVGHELGLLITYPFWVVGIPLLFFIFGDQKDDRLIGEISFPLYLVHHLVVVILFLSLGYLGLERGLGVSCAVGSIALAGIFYRVFIVPLDRKRQQLTGAHSAETGGGGARATTPGPQGR